MCFHVDRHLGRYVSAYLNALAFLLSFLITVYHVCWGRVPQLNWTLINSEGYLNNLDGGHLVSASETPGTEVLKFVHFKNSDIFLAPKYRHFQIIMTNYHANTHMKNLSWNQDMLVFYTTEYLGYTTLF